MGKTRVQLTSHRSASELEAFCDLKLENEHAKNTQRKVAAHLATLYRHGYVKIPLKNRPLKKNVENLDEEIEETEEINKKVKIIAAKDEVKVKKYENYGKPVSSLTWTQKARIVKDALQNVYPLVKNNYKNWNYWLSHLTPRTATLYLYHVIFTGFRLFWVRFHRAFNQATRLTLTPYELTYLGASYGLGLIIDTAVIIKTLRAKPDPVNDYKIYRECWEKRKDGEIVLRHPYKLRCKQFLTIVTKDDRLFRMSNDFTWTLVNVICFFVTGGLYAILNLCGFSFDVGYEIAYGIRDFFRRYRQLKGFNKQLAALPETAEKEGWDAATLKTKTDKIEDIIAGYQKSLCVVGVKTLYKIGITILILTGMVLIWYPPAGSPILFAGITTAVFSGSCLALSGSIFGGIGKRILKWVKLDIDKGLENIALGIWTLFLKKKTSQSNSNQRIVNRFYRPALEEEPRIRRDNVSDLRHDDNEDERLVDQTVTSDRTKVAPLLSNDDSSSDDDTSTPPLSPNRDERVSSNDGGSSNNSSDDLQEKEDEAEIGNEVNRTASPNLEDIEDNAAPRSNHTSLEGLPVMKKPKSIPTLFVPEKQDEPTSPFRPRSPLATSVVTPNIHLPGSLKITKLDTSTPPQDKHIAVQEPAAGMGSTYSK